MAAIVVVCHPECVSRSPANICGHGARPVSIRALCTALGIGEGRRPGNDTTVMARLVMKFGGTSVADIDRIRNVARHVKREVDAGHEVAVVVSAMAGTTDQLVGWCEAALKTRQLFDAREYDAVVASGEQVTAGLLAIALQDMDINARSWQGWQLPILTSNAHGSARILDINGAESDQALQRARRSRGHRRLPGHAQGDRPHHHARPRRLGHVGGGDRGRDPAPTAATSTPTSTASTPPIRAWCRARAGSTRSRSRKCWSWPRSAPRCMQVRSVELGMVHNVRIFVRSSFDRPEDIDPHGTPPGTLICDEEEIMEQQVVTGIAFSTRRGANLDPARCRTSPASPPRSSARWPRPTSTST